MKGKTWSAIVLRARNVMNQDSMLDDQPIMNIRKINLQTLTAVMKVKKKAEVIT